MRIDENQVKSLMSAMNRFYTFFDNGWQLKHGGFETLNCLHPQMGI